MYEISRAPDIDTSNNYAYRWPSLVVSGYLPPVEGGGSDFGPPGWERGRGEGHPV